MGSNLLSMKHTSQAQVYLDGFSCIYRDLVVCGVSVLQSQVIVLNFQVQVWKKELHHQGIWSDNDK